MPAVDLVLPGDIESLTGGYIYDRHIVDGLAARDWQTTIHSLDSSFPEPSTAALEEARQTFAAIPDGRVVVIDGLALGGTAEILAAQTRRLRLVALVHHPLALETGLQSTRAEWLRLAETASLAQVRHVVVTSRWTMRALADYDIPSERIAVVEPGTAPAPARRVSGGESLTLLCVASLTARKGHTILFDALARLRDRDWQLNCAGSLTSDRHLVDTLREQIERERLGERIHLLGELPPPRVVDEYAKADVFVLASYMEGYGMALTEALARGIPVISTSAGAIPDTVPRDAGVLVPRGDSAALAEALARVMDDPATLERLNEGARAARRNLPTWELACDNFAQQLSRALSP